MFESILDGKEMVEVLAVDQTHGMARIWHECGIIETVETKRLSTIQETAAENA